MVNHKDVPLRAEAYPRFEGRRQRIFQLPNPSEQGIERLNLLTAVRHPLASPRPGVRAKGPHLPESPRVQLNPGGRHSFEQAAKVSALSSELAPWWERVPVWRQVSFSMVRITPRSAARAAQSVHHADLVSCISLFCGAFVEHGVSVRSRAQGKFRQSSQHACVSLTLPSEAKMTTRFWWLAACGAAAE